MAEWLIQRAAFNNIQRIALNAKGIQRAAFNDIQRATFNAKVIEEEVINVDGIYES